MLTQAKKIIHVGLQKSLKADSAAANTMEDLYIALRRRYANFVKAELLERIMFPLYDGLRESPNETAYIWTVRQVNEMFADLGIMTVPVKVGDIYDDNLPYIPSEESQDEKYQTNDNSEKDKICEILRYAYTFKDDAAGESQRINDGSVIVKVYRPEGV